MLVDFGTSDSDRAIIEATCKANGWFCKSDILRAVDAIRSRFLDRTIFAEWLNRYPRLPHAVPRDVGVVMAGNIPLVGFFDLMCVVAAGCRCHYKASSKERVMTDFVVDAINRLAADKVVVPLADDDRLDAVIATGSASANVAFEARWGNCPTLLRGSRTSIAVIDGTESDKELALLNRDIMWYSGAGCRSVSAIALPLSMPTERIAERIANFYVDPTIELSDSYRGNYRQTRALLTLNETGFTDCGAFVLVESWSIPSHRTQINLMRYKSVGQVEQWIDQNDDNIQCVVSNLPLHHSTVGFGEAQYPAIDDYADGKDVMSFLQNI